MNVYTALLFILWPEQENENSNLMLRYIQIFGNVGKRTDIMMWEIFDWYAE